MSGPDICPICKGLHYKTSSCIVRVTKSTVRKNMPVANGVYVAERLEPRDSALSAKRPVDTTTPKPKRSGNRHKPGYFTEYMRDYRKGIRRSKAQ